MQLIQLVLRLIGLAALILVITRPAHSAVTVTNNGDGSTRLRADFVIPTAAAAADVRDDICRGAGWMAQVTCTQAMVSASQCAAGQLGTQVPNPESCLQAIDRKLRAFLRELRKAGEVQEAEEGHVKPVRDADHSGDIQ